MFLSTYIEIPVWPLLYLLHTSTCAVSWAAPVAEYWLTYKTSKSADVHHNRRTPVCRKDSCWSESLWGLTRDIDLTKEQERENKHITAQ